MRHVRLLSKVRGKSFGGDTLRKLSLVLLFIAASCFVAFAQDAPKNEVFAGYSYFKIDTGVVGGSEHANMNGWNVAATHFVTKNLGVTADLSGAYGSPDEFASLSTRQHNLMFGPTFAVARDKKVSYFAHALFGASHLHIGDGLDYSDNAFTMAYGGGVDASLSKHWSVRLAQVDYMYSNFKEDNQNHFRYSGGIVYRF
jgi:opacity protein-like surface antigen